MSSFDNPDVPVLGGPADVIKRIVAEKWIASRLFRIGKSKQGPE